MVMLGIMKWSTNIICNLLTGNAFSFLSGKNHALKHFMQSTDLSGLSLPVCFCKSLCSQEGHNLPSPSMGS